MGILCMKLKWVEKWFEDQLASTLWQKKSVAAHGTMETDLEDALSAFSFDYTTVSFFVSLKHNLNVLGWG